MPAVHISTDGFLSINGVDLSDHVISCSIEYSAEIHDKTAMGATARERLGGLKNWTMTVEFNDDESAGEIEATLFPIVGSSVAVLARKDNAAGVGASNPNYSGNGLLETLPVFNQNVGEIARTQVTFQGDGDMSRLTS